MKSDSRNYLTRALVAGIASLVLIGSLRAAGEEGNAELQVQARHIESLQKMVVGLHERQRLLEERVETLESLRAEIGKLNEQLGMLRSQITSLQGEIENLLREFKGYQSDYRKWARIDAIGEKIPMLVVANGKSYENVEIRRVTESGLEIRHDGGSTRLLHNHLPGDVRDRFQWDGEAAALALAEETKNELLRDRLHALSARQTQQKRAEAAQVAATDKRIRSLENKLAAAQASSFGSRLHSSGGLGDRRPVGRSTSRYLYGARTRTSVYYYPAGRSYFPTPRRVVSRPAPRGAITPRSYGVRLPTRSMPRPPVRRNTTPMRRCPNGRD